MLGDLIESALSSVGITKERVEKFVGRPCGCRERQRRINSLQSWATRIIMGKKDEAEKLLNDIVGTDEISPLKPS